jgi:glycosyltransferase involved in cell wall biosynthesis
MVTRNEASRYLDPCLRWLRECVDEIHVYDDQSDDETPDVILSHGCELTVRPDGVPSFLEHEGRFRQAAWNAFEQTIRPEINDWVLSIDADEFLVADGKVRLQLLLEATEAMFREEKSVFLIFKEVFSYLDNTPLIRTDGYWDTIGHPRFFKYEPNASFSDRSMGSGSEPTYVQESLSQQAQDLVVLHFGYAREEDRRSKYERYAALPGHSSAHVRSILQPGKLTPWTGPVPCLT